MSSRFWTDKDGTRTRIDKLDDKHLFNILRMLYRRDMDVVRAKIMKQAKGEDAQAVIDSGSLFDNPAGLAAYEHADKLRHLATEAGDRDLLIRMCPQLPHIEHEARRRGILHDVSV